MSLCIYQHSPRAPRGLLEKGVGIYPVGGRTIDDLGIVGCWGAAAPLHRIFDVPGRVG